ncbi:MAG TPA: outer membrane beta-barrel protein [Puia sp.]|nr:outer membrane beta-barrel protein [Puia sp.]
MKRKFLLPVAFIIISANVLQAQIEKRDWLLGGTFGFSTTSNGSSPAYSNANITPHIGYALSNNAVVGLNLSLNYIQNNSNNNNFDLSTNLFYKKFFPSGQKFGVYARVNAGLGWSENTYTLLDSAGSNVKKNFTITNYIIGAAPGIYYKIAPGILLDADCGGIVYYYSKESGGHVSNFSINFFSSFIFGIEFILGKKRDSN